MTTATALTMNSIPDLSIIDGQVTTTSVQVAQHFNKRHRDVIRAINNLARELPSEWVRNFAQGYYTMAETGEQQHKMYRLTRDGFTLLAMGFTGKEALQWKLAYLQAFNRMEAELLKRANHNAIGYDRINPEQAQHLKELVQLVAESGKQGYSETWARLHRKFKVNSYLQLRPDQFTEACLYLKGKMDAESIGNLIAKHIDISTLERLAPQSNMDQVLLAMRTANELAASVQEHMFKKLVRSEASPLADRWVLSFNSGSHGLQPMTSTIERESFIATPSTFADMVAKSEANLTNEELAKIASACSQKLARRMTQTTALLGA